MPSLFVYGIKPCGANDHANDLATLERLLHHSTKVSSGGDGIDILEDPFPAKCVFQMVINPPSDVFAVRSSVRQEHFSHGLLQVCLQSVLKGCVVAYSVTLNQKPPNVK